MSRQFFAALFFDLIWLCLISIFAAALGFGLGYERAEDDLEESLECCAEEAPDCVVDEET